MLDRWLLRGVLSLLFVGSRGEREGGERQREGGREKERERGGRERRGGERGGGSGGGERQRQLSMLLYVHRSTETMKIIRDGETRSSTSTFTQLLSSGLWHECIIRNTQTVHGITQDKYFKDRSAVSLFQSSSRYLYGARRLIGRLIMVGVRVSLDQTVCPQLHT